MVVVGGGDGTISAAAKHFAYGGTVLAVLPLGTGNAFARDLGLPSGLEEACALLKEGHVARVDMGEIEGRAFLNVATFGVSTLIAKGLDPSLKRRWGRAVYLASLLRAVCRARPIRAKLVLDGREEEFESLQVVIGNGRFHAGPFLLAPDARIDSGRLSVYALASPKRRHFLRMAFRLYGGRHVEMEEVRSYSVEAGSLETWPTKQGVVDGEVCVKTPARFRSVPGALRVAVPAPKVTQRGDGP
jgi:YegS/Rv2252/BmrU family lipid kinase